MYCYLQGNNNEQSACSRKELNVRFCDTQISSFAVYNLRLLTFSTRRLTKKSQRSFKTLTLFDRGFSLLISYGRKIKENNNGWKMFHNNWFVHRFNIYNQWSIVIDDWHTTSIDIQLYIPNSRKIAFIIDHW